MEVDEFVPDKAQLCDTFDSYINNLYIYPCNLKFEHQKSFTKVCIVSSNFKSFQKSFTKVSVVCQGILSHFRNHLQRFVLCQGILSHFRNHLQRFVLCVKEF
jgi:hypothetical protein